VYVQKNLSCWSSDDETCLSCEMLFGAVLRAATDCEGSVAVTVVATVGVIVVDSR